jgi:hypothetical protein
VPKKDNVGNVQPGWYPDPDGKPCERYWDGTKWGEATQPISQPSKEPTKAKKKGSAGKAWAWVIGIGIFLFTAMLLYSAQQGNRSLADDLERQYGGDDLIQRWQNDLNEFESNE